MVNQTRRFLSTHDCLVDQVRGRRSGPLGFTSCDKCSSFALARQACAAHQPGCVLTPNVNALASQHAPHLPHPVDTVVFGNERHEYAPQEQRREDYGRLSPGLWIGGTHTT